MSDRDIYQILESLDAAQRSVKQLPALFRPADTSPQLDGAYPGQNATRGYMVGEGEERSLDDMTSMGRAVLYRIANQRPEWFMKYGLDAVKQAIQDVTGGEDDWEEIGSSDVSAFVGYVGDYLRDHHGSREEMQDRKPFAEHDGRDDEEEETNFDKDDPKDPHYDYVPGSEDDEDDDLSETSDYARRREREEKIISGQKPARKKAPAQTSDYARRREQQKKQGVAEGSLEEYGDTPKGQKMLGKVQARAATRIMKNWNSDDRDYAANKKNRDNAERAYARIVGKKDYSKGVAEGFVDSSKDYGTDEVTITFDGDIPSKEEIIQYCKKNYGFIPSSIDIDPPSDFRGMVNPGIIRVKQGVAEGKDISDMEMHRLNVERFRKDLGLPDIDKPKKNRETDMDIHQKNVERFRKDLGLDKNKGVAEGALREFRDDDDSGGGDEGFPGRGSWKLNTGHYDTALDFFSLFGPDEYQDRWIKDPKTGEVAWEGWQQDETDRDAPGRSIPGELRKMAGFRWDNADESPEDDAPGTGWYYSWSPDWKDIYRQGRDPKGGVSESRDTATEDILSAVKAKLGDYIQDVATAIKKDPDLLSKLPTGANEIRAVKTLRTDDGHEIKIHGTEDDGFRISIKNQDIKSTFQDLDEAVMAVEIYCARRRQQAREADYIDEKTS